MEFIHLTGTEDVQRAASQMSSAAHEMKNVASSIEHTFFLHQRFLEEWIQRFEAVIDKLKGE